jgi:integrase
LSQQGTVTLRRRAKGPDVWVFIYRDGDSQRTRRIGIIEKYPTKASAEKQAQKLRRSINDQLECLFVSDLLDRYEKDDLPARGPTNSAYRSSLKRIRERWGKMRLEAQAEDMMGIELWINNLETVPTKNTKARLLAKKSRTNLKALLHRLFERAIFWGMLELQRNPVGLVSVKGKSGRTRPLILVTVEAYGKMLKDPELVDHVRMMVMIAMCLGLRASEILGLRWESFDNAAEPTLTVNR